MASPTHGEWYSRRIYPFLSGVLSRFSSVFPFSIGDCFIYGSIFGLLFYLGASLIRRYRVKRTLRHIVEYLLWVYVWFYMAWGLNYFRQDFFVRAQIHPVTYSAEEFQTFLSAYTDSLNSAYLPIHRVDTPQVKTEVLKGFSSIHERFGITRPAGYMKAKPILISPLMSSGGIKGYMGPFFTEYNLNRELQPVEYASTYAHELAHALSITGEAEANFYSFLVCSQSKVAEIRFSGYFSLLPYVLGNTYRLLSEDEFKMWRESLRPEVRTLYNEKVAYWQTRYNPLIGEMQNRLYNFYLKGNKIPSGTANYSEVIALLIAYNHDFSGF
ncbi:DUF3810 domain-containing protein [Parabacteroides sp. PF5-9]|uniref:DUF3810 domain-containing protein n=1 Tax=Parabacteroides sp. PF5-9 TaxID=1742404 RepID=UPI002476CA76|nr:DUF3810 domain-containing protein [Parabacteroides sp. PF5-9]